MKENSLSSLLENDNDYQRYSTYGSIAEEQYMQLDLSTEQKDMSTYTEDDFSIAIN